MNPQDLSWNPLQLLWDLTAAVGRIEARMADFATDLATIQQAVTEITSDIGDLTSDSKGVTDAINQLRSQLGNAGLSASQQSALDQVTQSASQLHQGLQAAHQQLQAAVQPPATPGGPATGGTPGTGSGPAPQPSALRGSGQPHR